MGLDKWELVKKKVSKEETISMLNFKEGPKRPMLKVQYFKHPNIAGHFYDRFLVAYGRFPWNDEVPIYFARLFYAEFVLGMHPDYTSLPSWYYGVGKDLTYNWKGAYRDASLSRPPPPFISLQTREFSSHEKM